MTSNVADSGITMLVGKAAELGAAVLKEKTPQAARAYIGWIAELDPAVYRPAEGELELALNLAVTDMLGADLRPNQQSSNYAFFRGVAKIYGLGGLVKEYTAEIAKLDSR